MDTKHTPDEIEDVIAKVVDSFWPVMKELEPNRDHYDSEKYYTEGHCVSLVEILCNVFKDTDDVKIYADRKNGHYVTWINDRIYDYYGDREKYFRIMRQQDPFEFTYYGDVDMLEDLVVGAGHRYDEFGKDAEFTDSMIEVGKEMLNANKKTR